MAYVEDVKNQVELSLQLVENLTQSRRTTFTDVSRTTARFTSPVDLATQKDWRAQHAQQAMLLICALSDISRSELLVEIERKNRRLVRIVVSTRNEVQIP